MPNENDSDVKQGAANASLGADSDSVEMGSETHQEQDVNDSQPSLQDAVRQHLGVKTDADSEEGAKSTDQSSESHEEDAKKSDSDSETDQADESKDESEKETEEVDTETEDGDDEGKEEEIGPVPYDRFKQVNEKLRTTEGAVQALKPKADNFDQILQFCEQGGITGKQFEDTMQTMALINTNPAEALKRLLPIVEELQGFTGTKLPDDLQARVDAESLDVETAREIAQLRAQTKFGAKKSEYDQKVAAERQQRAFERSLMEASMTWETGKQSTDPDYKEGSTKWELTKKFYLSMVNEIGPDGSYVNPVTSPQKMTELMERAYMDASKTIARLTGRKAVTKKKLPSNGSSSVAKDTRIETAPTLQIAVARALANRK